MELNLTEKQFRRLLDLVYIGNWVLNSTRGDDRIREYDEVESQVFAHCLDHGMAKLVELYDGELIPSRAFAEGGIHEAIMAYEDVTFFEILAEELALKDLGSLPGRITTTSWSGWRSTWASSRRTAPTTLRWIWNSRWIQQNNSRYALGAYRLCYSRSARTRGLHISAQEVAGQNIHKF